MNYLLKSLTLSFLLTTTLLVALIVNDISAIELAWFGIFASSAVSVFCFLMLLKEVLCPTSHT